MHWIMKAAGDQVKKMCGSLKLCAGLEAGIEEATHTMAHKKQKRTVPAPG